MKVTHETDAALEVLGLARIAAADPIDERLGDRLRRLRRARGQSLDALASLSGISRAYLWKLEKSHALNPGIQTLRALAPPLQCRPGYLADTLE